MAGSLTELEGAVLTEVGHRGNTTAFKVRRAFELSGAASWRGSAGAVYAAVKRLIARQLLETEPIAGRRGGNRLGLTTSGKRALRLWMLDFERASDSGFDPFRLRAGLWLRLPDNQLAHQLDLLEQSVISEIARLRVYAEGQDQVERTEVDLAIRLQELRLRWINEQKDALRGRRRCPLSTPCGHHDRNWILAFMGFLAAAAATAAVALPTCPSSWRCHPPWKGLASNCLDQSADQ
jgi:DNA-binding PadR family transcriptional regulator